MIRCPRCLGKLSVAPQLLHCAACGPWPLLADVPVLVPAPAAYCASFREALLATLAEHDAAGRETVAVIDAFAAESDAEPSRFGDDWTAHEAEGALPPKLVRGPGLAPLSRLIALAHGSGPAGWLEKKVGTAKHALELGCGAGERSVRLAKRVERLVIGDLSLRAVLRARARASREQAEVTGVVLDAEALPFKAKSFDVVVAEHLVDLLDAPGEFLDAARRVLVKGGRLLITTPDPALGSGDDQMLRQLAVDAGFRVREVRDGLPWLRVNSARFVESYLVQALELIT